MRSFFLRCSLSFALAWTTACADDILEVVTTGSSSGDDSTAGPGTVSADTTVGLDTTEGPSTDTEGTSNSTTGSSSSGEPESSSSGESSSSSSSSSSSGSSDGGPMCGDDTAEPGETCDGTDLVGEDCGSQGFDAGTLGCMPDCSAFDTSACILFSCGNDLIEGIELCDGLDLAGQDCSSQGFDAGTLGCAPDCTAFDTSACFVITCGDDVIDGTDVCDGIDLAGQDCGSQGFDAGTLACLADCTAFDTSACITFSCGNDILEGIEVCDGSALAGADCVAQGFDGGTLACLPDCTAYDTGGCHTCGDDVTAGPEVCDGIDLAGSDCAAQGFDGGTLACVPDCSAFDTAGCYVCGDDVAAGPEVCDGTDLVGSDCAAQGFDGGTLGCQPDCSALDTAGCYVCGDGVAAGPEVCDGADLLGNDCLDVGFDGGTLACDAACAFDPSACTICGDGVIAGTEQCDGANLGGQTCVGLGFQFGNLGCTNGCDLSQIHCVNITSETEPNDDTMVAVATNDFSAANANGPYTSDALISAAINPLGDDDVFAISNPGATYTIVTLETYGPIPGACDPPTDTVLFLHLSNGLQLATNGDSGINSCSLLTGVILPPGVTLYVRVTDFGDNTLIPGYHLHIRFDPVVCGDDLAGPGEQCEDGNTADGDGCSATCVLEGAIQEIEPNATGAQADTNAMNGVVITDDTQLAGVVGPALGDVDRFRIDLAAPQHVRFETFTSLGQCNNGLATTLRLFDSVGVQIITDNGPLVGSGIANCAALVFPLPAGTFYVQVEETGNNSLIPTYVLEVELLGDAGIELEPNEDQASANPNLAGGVSDVFVFADHTMQVDSDYYAIDVPVTGSSLRLEIIEGDRALETCEALGVDSRLTLYDSAGVQLVDDDNDGRGFCSIVDGTGFGATPQDAAAHDLPAGTYYAQVRASVAAQATAAGQFTYRLVATVRQP